MSLPRRISAGGLVFKGDAVLLVRYRAIDSDETYLVGPGGGLEDEENIVQAIIRETREETGVTVRPMRVVAIEDLLSMRHKMIKVWMVCEFIEGEVRKTGDADREGIIAAAWFTRDQLAGEVVFPSLLVERAWEQLRSGTGEVEILPSRKARY